MAATFVVLLFGIMKQWVMNKRASAESTTFSEFAIGCGVSRPETFHA
jgi:hypothetical protein